MNHIDNDIEKIDIVKAYLKRNLVLYIAWFIVLFPITLVVRKYYTMGIIGALKKFLIQFLLSSTFIASWYLMATLIGTLLVIISCRYFGELVTFIIGILLFLICCGLTNYYGLFSESILLRTIEICYPVNFYNSFPASVLWIIIGKIFAEHDFNIKRKMNLLLLLTSIVALFCEEQFVKSYSYTDDWYIMLFPICILLFALIKDSMREVPFSQQMRSFSTVTFCLHASLGIVLDYLIGKYLDVNIFPGATVVFVLTVFGCIIVTLVLLKYSRHMKLLRMFY